MAWDVDEEWIEKELPLSAIVKLGVIQYGYDRCRNEDKAVDRGAVGVVFKSTALRLWRTRYQ